MRKGVSFMVTSGQCCKNNLCYHLFIIFSLLFKTKKFNVFTSLSLVCFSLFTWWITGLRSALQKGTLAQVLRHEINYEYTLCWPTWRWAARSPHCESACSQLTAGLRVSDSGCLSCSCLCLQHQYLHQRSHCKKKKKTLMAGGDVTGLGGISWRYQCPPFVTSEKADS